MLHAQHIVLSGDTSGAVIEVTDPQVFAAHGDHRPGTETKTFRAEDGSLDDVLARFEPTVSLQPYLVAQIVRAQQLMGFRQTQFPGAASILDRGERAGAGTAVIPRDGDQIGVGLGHAGSNRPHTGLGH